MPNPSTSSGAIAVGTTSVVTRPCRLMSMIVVGGSAASTITVYDNASAASGTVLAAFSCAASTTWSDHFGDGLVANNGLTVVVAGTAAVGYIGYVG